MNRLALLAVVLVLGFCGTAEATTITGENLSLPYQRWVDESQMPTPDGTLTVVEDPTQCPLFPADDACAGADIFWFDPQMARWARHWTFMHLLGHSFDFLEMTDADRSLFTSWLHTPRSWWGPNPPGEVFANAYAACAWPPHPGQTSFYRPLKRRACRLIRRVGLRSGVADL